MMCPRCGSVRVETTMKSLTNDGLSLNKAYCHACRHTGTAQDWIDIEDLKEEVRSVKLELYNATLPDIPLPGQWGPNL